MTKRLKADLHEYAPDEVMHTSFAAGTPEHQLPEWLRKKLADNPIAFYDDGDRSMAAVEAQFDDDFTQLSVGELREMVRQRVNDGQIETDLVVSRANKQELIDALTGMAGDDVEDVE